MGAKARSAPKGGVTSMRLSSEILAAANRKAATLGVPRSEYFRKLLRRDLKLDMKEPQSGIFG